MRNTGCPIESGSGAANEDHGDEDAVCDEEAEREWQELLGWAGAAPVAEPAPVSGAAPSPPLEAATLAEAPDSWAGRLARAKASAAAAAAPTVAAPPAPAPVEDEEWQWLVARAKANAA